MAMVTCKHCGLRITGDTYSTHMEGLYRGKHSCDPEVTKQPYGLSADPVGEPCNALCREREK